VCTGTPVHYEQTVRKSYLHVVVHLQRVQDGLIHVEVLVTRQAPHECHPLQIAGSGESHNPRHMMPKSDSESESHTE